MAFSIVIRSGCYCCVWYFIIPCVADIVFTDAIKRVSVLQGATPLDVVCFEYRTNTAPATTCAGGLGAKAPAFGNLTFNNPAAGSTPTGYALPQPQPQPTTANLQQKTVRFELPTTASTASPLTSLLASTTAASTVGQSSRCELMDGTVLCLVRRALGRAHTSVMGT